MTTLPEVRAVEPEMVALRQQMEHAKLDPVCYADFPTDGDLAAARDRLRNL